MIKFTTIITVITIKIDLIISEVDKITIKIINIKIIMIKVITIVTIVIMLKINLIICEAKLRRWSRGANKTEGEIDYNKDDDIVLMTKNVMMTKAIIMIIFNDDSDHHLSR